MRDIFGVDLRTGDTMELHCVKSNEGGTDFCEFVPVIREHQYMNTLQDKINQGKTYCFRLGKVWATPLHGPFNGMEKNIVGYEDEDNLPYNFSNGNPNAPAGIYKNIEVELSPSFICEQGRL